MSTQQYRLEELPAEYRKMLLAHLESTDEYKEKEKKVRRDVRKMTLRLQSYQNLEILKDRYLRAALDTMKTREKIKELYDGLHIEFSVLKSKLQGDDAEKFENLSIAMMFVSDLLESYVSSLNYIVHKVYPEHDFAKFDKMIELAKESKALFEEYHRGKSEDFETLYADEADKIQDYIETKRMPVFLRRVGWSKTNKKEKNNE